MRVMQRRSTRCRAIAIVLAVAVVPLAAQTKSLMDLIGAAGGYMGSDGILSLGKSGIQQQGVIWC